MKACGLVVEYNPFHNGHAYHIEQAKKESHAEVMVAVMSGNFLQRGEPAIYNKWTRTNEALKNGIDLVIELPFAFATQSADYFARGSIALLQALQVDSLCFGTDSKETVDYVQFARFHQENKALIEARFQQLKNNGMNYPQQMTAVYRELCEGSFFDFSSPNHILGMAYAKENQTYKTPMKLLPIKRQLADFHEATLNSSSRIASASAIRNELFKNSNHAQLKKVVPAQTFLDICFEPKNSWNAYFSLLKYKLITSSHEELATIYQMTEGIEYRLKDKIKASSDFESFVNSVKSKRFTHTRIQRLCTYILGNVTQAEINAVWAQPFIRILGFNQTGRSFLKERKNNTPYPFITNIAKANEKKAALDIKMGQIYQLSQKMPLEQDYYRKPIFLDTANQ